MAKIKQLPLIEAQKIAAGEVVERPANIVKELVENALDAESTEITLYIEDGGKKLIRIIDNGCGMSVQDAQLAFAHHATSKLNTVDDLHSLTTFGFRGEALSSIASVSHVTLITKDAESSIGTKIDIAFGEHPTQEEVSTPVGTQITVQELFARIPARKKFLKATDTEWNQIAQFFYATCLAYPHIHFRLFNNNKLAYNCPPVSTTRERSAQLWERDVEPYMLEVAAEPAMVQNTIQLTGIISNPQVNRYNRQHMYFFVNQRWIKNQTLARSVLNGYQNVLPRDKFPIIVLFITLPPDQVDINIHPRKEEVRFLHPRSVEVLLSSQVKKILENHLSRTISLPSSHAENKQSYQPHHPNYDSSFIDQAFKKALMPSHILTTQDFYKDTFEEPIVTKTAATLESVYAPPVHQPEFTQSPTHEVLSIASSNINSIPEEHSVLIGQFKKTYLLIERPDGLFMLDQHAAHERILYERFSQKIAQSDTIQLLFPQPLSFSSFDIAQLMTVQKVFKQYGVLFEQSGPENIIVTAAPVYGKHLNFRDLLSDALVWIEQYQELEPEECMRKINHALCAQMACKAAIKAGDILNESQMLQLLKDLAITNNRFACPHGRPTGWLMETVDIEKKFKRRT